MINEIIKEVKSIKGTVLGIGIEDKKVLDEIEKNKNIQLCFLLNNYKKNTNKKFKLNKKGKTKKINIKKLKKHFRKKSFDNIICNYETIKKFYKSFVPNSIYINKGKLFVYGNIKYLENIKEKYERYTSEIITNKNNKNFLLIINNKDVKTNIIKTNYYKIKDTLNEILDYLTEFLTN